MIVLTGGQRNGIGPTPTPTIGIEVSQASGQVRVLLFFRPKQRDHDTDFRQVSLRSTVLPCCTARLLRIRPRGQSARGKRHWTARVRVRCPLVGRGRGRPVRDARRLAAAVGVRGVGRASGGDGALRADPRAARRRAGPRRGITLLYFT